MVQLMMNGNFDWNEVDNIARAFVDMKLVHNAWAEVIRQNDPLGHSFEASSVFNRKCEERDPFLNYRINSRHLSG